jgi:hypothetical protein
MVDIIKAIVAINPDAKVYVNAEDFEQITWLDGTAEISKADIEAKQAELAIAEADAKVAKEAADAQLVIDKASAKAKLIAGEALTEAEADTIVL